MAKILTGIQSSGRPHLGNILGAIKPAVEMSKNEANTSFLFIADLHSLTTIKDPQTLRQNTSAIAAAWLAFGFDTDRNYFYRQSRVAEFHTELAWYLQCLTPFPMLANALSFKDKSDKLADVNAGLFTYPVLQAADIILYDAEFVPVGKDQKQHLEMSKDMAAAFNRTYGQTFVLPEPKIDETVMVIPGIDGRKMSKSLNNYIDIFLPEKELRKSVMKIVSDSTPLELPKKPDDDITFKLYALLASAEQTEAMRQNYVAGGYGFGAAKQALYELILTDFATERRIFDYYMANEAALEAKLRAGEAKARVIARKKIEEVRAKIGF